MKIKDYINFSRKWNKLEKRTFTTIRGKTAIEQYILNHIIHIQIKKNNKFYAKIMDMKLMPISEIPLSILQEDIAPQKCNSHQDFADYLNSIWEYVDVTVNKMVTLFTLERTKEIGWRKKTTTQSRLNPFKKK